ncbi:Diacetylchitobiose uptake system permease protein NgcF [Paenibacillus allorhizoplanae]|uniref:Diacetylchitobiose uptake system permease protein NgcF n=1 Tax=Paenibacillus allorhizoplanae TaxID=2905648 RepID=A0ABN8GXX2_9BACL|nr:sugar ABC transporter permease [Paenibacillus allorhizoplanae]CAH1217622.1 Diacetylchitobiose uptake system permease protein NgcF [Paenibacillus allorhizoplanae]
MRNPISSNRALTKWANLFYVAPAVALFLLFSLFPLFRTFQYSFTDANGVNPNVNYIGFTNYINAITDPVWWHAIGNGLFFAGMALLFMNSIALLLSVAVHSGIRGNKIYRVLFYIPPILSGIVVGYVWKWIYEPTGLLNSLLTFIGLESWTHSWIAETETALTAVSVTSMWQGVGGSFILFLAGLQGVPKDLYEAADLDGASRRQKLIHITIPSLKRVYTMVNILTILGAMEIFNQVFAMTLGGPGYTTEVPAIRIYREAFKNSNFGLASAFSVIFGAMLFVISYIQLKLSQRKE